MNINTFMQQKTYKKLEHNQPYPAKFNGYRMKQTTKGFMISFDFKLENDRIESHNAHYSEKTESKPTESGEILTFTNVNDQITPFIKRLVAQCPQALQDNLDGQSNETILAELQDIPVTIYPIFSEYEFNGQIRTQRDLWFEPKVEQQPEEETEVDF